MIRPGSRSWPKLDLIDAKPTHTAQTMGLMNDLVLPPDTAPAEVSPPATAGGPKTVRQRISTAWAAVRAAMGGLLGLLPHVLHHVGILAGTALLTGLWGSAVLYVAGLLLSIPMLKRLRRRFHTRLAPLVGVVAFTTVFLVSALVIGPAFSGAQSPQAGQNPASSAPAPTTDHASHHR